MKTERTIKNSYPHKNQQVVIDFVLSVSNVGY